MIIGTAQKKDKREVINKEKEKKTMKRKREKEKECLKVGERRHLKCNFFFSPFKQ